MTYWYHTNGYVLIYCNLVLVLAQRGPQARSHVAVCDTRYHYELCLTWLVLRVVVATSVCAFFV